MVKNEIKKFKLTAGEYSDISCTLPFTVCSVFVDNGYMQDPYIERNIENASTSIPDKCSFSANVELSVAEVSAKHLYLKISGVIGSAEVFFNGKNYGAIKNSNSITCFDIADMAEVGGNVLEIRAYEPICKNRPLTFDGSISTEFEMAPYIADMGIVGSCEIISTSSAIIKEVRISQKHVDGRVALNIGMDTLGTSDDVRAMATLVSPTGKIYFGGIVSGEGTVSIPDPELWWPNGLGNQLLYRLTVTLYKGEIATDSYQCELGLRSVSLERSESGAPYINVNGAKIFSMGATYVAEDSVFPRINKKRTERLIKQAAQSNMNTLRVISGGVCPPDFFYELCDKYGILVWQDIPTPYTTAPVADTFAAGLTDALRDVIARTTRHTCVAITYLSVTEGASGACATSESEISEFCDVVSRILAPVVDKYGNGISYVSDSYELFGYDEKYSNSHGASVALPSKISLSSFIPENEMNLTSPTAELHSAGGSAVADMLSDICQRFRFPNGMDELIYVSSLCAAYAADESVKKRRMERDCCMSAVCRQFNDGWPSISSSAVDFYGRSKAFMYLAKKFFSPVCAIAAADGGKMTFGISNESRKAYTGRLVCSLYSSDGTCIREIRTDVNAEPLSSAVVSAEDFSEYIKGSVSDYYVIYELSEQKGITSSGVALFVPPKRFEARNCDIEAQISGSGKKFTVKLSSKAMCLGVYIGFGNGIDVRVSDNYLDMNGISPVMVSLETKETVLVKDLESALKLETVFGIGKQIY